MLETEFNDVYTALYELAEGMCKETDNNCKKCPFYDSLATYGCLLIEVKYKIYKAENRVRLRERNRNNYNNNRDNNN